MNKRIHSLFCSSAYVGNINQNFLATTKIADSKELFDVLFSEIDFSEKMFALIKPGGLLILTKHQNQNLEAFENVHTAYYHDYTIFRKKPEIKKENFYFSIKQALFWGNIHLNFTEDFLLETQILLSFALGVNTAHLYTFPEQKLTHEQEIQFQSTLQQRIKRIPLGYILGHTGFMSLNFHVSPAVLIPRPETEFIAEYVIDNYKNKQITGLDLATGSGCLAISILHNLPDSKFIASDISHDALIITKKNALTHNVYNRLLLVNGDMLSPFTTATFDIIVSNPPYISLNDYKNTLAPELQHEPSIALTDGKDGYHFYKIITTQTALHLKSEGELLLELGFGQLSQVIKFIPDTLFVQKIIKDYSGIDRVLVLRKK